MRGLFIVNKSANLINFIGRFPNGRPMISEIVPARFEGGLLYRAIEEIVNERNNLLLPVLGSYNSRIENISFSLIHPATNMKLVYRSKGSFAGYGVPDFYEENLFAENHCSNDEFFSKLDELNFIPLRFHELKKLNPLEVANEDEIKGVSEMINFYHQGEDGRLKC